jgi:hypothetical protein
LAGCLHRRGVAGPASGLLCLLVISAGPVVSTAVSIAGPVRGVWFWRCEPISGAVSIVGVAVATYAADAAHAAAAHTAATAHAASHAHAAVKYQCFAAENMERNVRISASCSVIVVATVLAATAADAAANFLTGRQWKQHQSEAADRRYRYGRCEHRQHRPPPLQSSLSSPNLTAAPWRGPFEPDPTYKHFPTQERDRGRRTGGPAVAARSRRSVSLSARQLCSRVQVTVTG